MPDFAEPLTRLIQEFKRLPGIGQKSAQRLAFHVLRSSQEDADRLVAAGVPVLYECFEGMTHGFLTMGGVVAAANHALYRLGQSLAQAFKPASG